MKNKVREWIELARIDLTAAQKLSGDEYLTPVVSFHAHQCIEKIFKAVVESNDMSVPKVHDLIRLYEMVVNIINFSCDEEVLYDLNRIYIDSRYPAMTGLTPYGRPEISDAAEYLGFSENVFNKILLILDK